MRSGGEIVNLLRRMSQSLQMMAACTKRNLDIQHHRQIPAQVLELQNGIECLQVSPEINEYLNDGNCATSGTARDNGCYTSRPIPPYADELELLVEIKYPNDKEEKIMLPKASVHDIFSSNKKREVIRKLLLYIHNHDVAFLRTCTLTGGSKVGIGISRPKNPTRSCRNQEQEIGGGKIQLPLRTTLIIHAIIRKMFPPSDKLPPAAHTKALTQLEKETRNLITVALYYFYNSFDEMGNKITKS